MSTEPDPLMRDEDAALLRDLIKATESNAAKQDRALLAMMAANIAGGMVTSTTVTEFVRQSATESSVLMARDILAKIDSES